MLCPICFTLYYLGCLFFGMFFIGVVGCFIALLAELYCRRKRD